MRDYYHILGVPASASTEVIKARYRFLSQAYHPDKFSSAEHKAQGEAEFKLINEAYQTLGDSPRRAAYDSTRRRHQQQNQQAPPKPAPSEPPLKTAEPSKVPGQMSPVFSWLGWQIFFWGTFGLIAAVFFSFEECSNPKRTHKPATMKPVPSTPAGLLTVPQQSRTFIPSKDLAVPAHSEPTHRRFFTAWVSEHHFVTLRDDFTWTATPETQRYLEPVDDLFWGGHNDHARVAFLMKKDLVSLGLGREQIVFLDKRRRWGNTPAELQNGRQPSYRGQSAALGDRYPGNQGTGVLTVDNGTAHQAVVKLIDQYSGQKVCSLLLQPNDVETLTGIPAGTYRMVFGLGDSFVSGTDQFESLFACSQFDENFVFRTVSTPSGQKFSTIRVTLHAVRTGRASTSVVPREEFEGY